MKVSQQSDVESSLNGLNELLHPELSGQTEAARSGGLVPLSCWPSPPQAELPVSTPGTATCMGQDASLPVGRRGEAPY